MSLAQGNGDRATLGHLAPTLGRAPSAATLAAALRAQEALEAKREAQSKPKSLRSLYVALRGTWTGFETLAVLVPWFITLLTCVLAFATPQLLIVVIIAQATAATLCTGAVLMSRRQH